MHNFFYDNYSIYEMMIWRVNKWKFRGNLEEIFEDWNILEQY